MSKTIASIALAAIAALSLSGCQQKSWEEYNACIDATYGGTFALFDGTKVNRPDHVRHYISSSRDQYGSVENWPEQRREDYGACEDQRPG